MKVLKKRMVLEKNLLRYVMAERDILAKTNHTFIVKLNYAFQTKTNLFLVLDYCPGGDLKKLLKQSLVPESKAKLYLAEILLAIEDLHKRDIIYRDLKPDNVVIDNDGHAVLTDFGLAKEQVPNMVDGAKSFCGSLAYMAPEVVTKQGHGKAVDWYLLGVVLY